ncbi:MAG TPA: glycosyltransferase family 39 protein [Vicinamibacteria bacterium]
MTDATAQPLARREARGWPFAVAALVSGACLLRWPYLDAPISADEGGYATAAYWWARGDTLYRGITITRPQGIFVLFRLIEALGLGSIRGIHLFAALYTALSALTVLVIAGRVWGRRIGLGAAALFALLMATPYVEGYGANAELFMTLPLLASLYCLLRADDRPLGARAGTWLIAGCGLLGAVALLIKPSGVAALPLAALWLLLRRRREGAGWAAWLRAEAALGLGFAAGLAPALAHGLLTAPEVYLDAVLLYRLRADSLVAGAAGYQATNFALNSLYVAGHLAPVCLLAAVGLAAARRDHQRRNLLWLWLATALGGMALGGDWFLHYYQQLLPPLAVAAALGARALLRRPDRPALLALQGLAGAGVALLALALAPTFVRPADPATLPEYEPGIAAAAPVAAYLRDHTAPAETVYVAYDHADIYYLSGRRPAARWLHFRELTRTPGAFEEQVARLADPATAPRYIVGAQRFDRWGLDADGRLRAVVARDYTLETTVEGVPLYRRN